MKNLLPTLRHALLLFLLLGTVQIASAYDFASGGIYYNITSSTNMTVAVTYDSKTNNTYSGTVTIPEKVTYNGKTYYVTAIGDYAFVGCTSLKGVNITSERTKTIGNYAFQGCNGMTSFVIPPQITSIGNYAFNGCYGMTSLVIEDSEETLQYTFDVGVHRQAAELFHELWTLPIRRQQDADESAFRQQCERVSELPVLWLHLIGDIGL